jgi:uncharacterized protein
MMARITKEFIAEGTTCEGCGNIIAKKAMSVNGVKDASYSYAKGKGLVTFDDSVTDIDTILSAIEEKGYACSVLERRKASSAIGFVAALIGLAVLLIFALMFADRIPFPQISPTMGYALLFAVGLLTGFHCIAMCGGFVISYSASAASAGRSAARSHILYAAGKLLSYTLIGAGFGLLGSIIAFTPLMRGIAGILAGIFLIVFGLRMLDVFAPLRRISIPVPRSVSRFVSKNSGRGPLVIGLLNGLMIACGPLQAIYIMAAGSGSVIEGAKLLLVFGLGTLPVMLSFGYLTSIISMVWTSRILKASGVVVIVLGLMMVVNGLTLSGYSPLATASEKGTVISKEIVQPVQSQGYQEIRMDVTASGWSPDKFVLKKGVPVHWIINGKEITSCNNAIQVPKLGLSFSVKPGEQVIEFTPTEEGVIPWSCWMGMIPGTFVVKDEVGDSASVQKALEELPAQKASGSCGCGMH